MIFDDYNWEPVKQGIDSFMKGYHKKIQYLSIEDGVQIFIRKIT